MKTWTLYSEGGVATRRFKGDRPNFYSTEGGVATRRFKGDRPNFYNTGLISLEQNGHEVAFIMLKPGEQLSMNESQVWS